MNRQQKIDSFFSKTSSKTSSKTEKPKRETVINSDSDKNDNPKVPSSQVQAITLSSDEEDMKPKTIPTFIITDDSDQSMTKVEEVSLSSEEGNSREISSNESSLIKSQSQPEPHQNETNESPGNEPIESESNENHPKVREFSIACLNQVSTLLHIAKKRNLENNIEAVQNKYYEKRKVPYLEDSWFYFNCDEKCDPDCEGEFQSP